MNKYLPTYRERRAPPLRDGVMQPGIPRYPTLPLCSRREEKERDSQRERKREREREGAPSYSQKKVFLAKTNELRAVICDLLYIQYVM